MRKIAVFFTLIALPAQAVAQSDCWRAGFGPYGAMVPAWALVTKAPTVKSATMIEVATPLRKGLVVARQELAIEPVTRYLTADVNVIDGNGKSLSASIPLGAGAQITLWRGEDGERQCVIGWKNGLFGGATGDGHYRWICFEDGDRDGRYDRAWRTATKNMGLSYSRLDIPLPTQVAWSETPPAAKVQASGGPLSSYPAARTIEVAKASGNLVEFAYWGAGAGGWKDNRASLALDQPGSVTMGGVTVSLVPQGKGKATVTATGAFDPLRPVATCNGTNYRLGEFETRVMFGFPNW